MDCCIFGLGVCPDPLNCVEDLCILACVLGFARSLGAMFEESQKNNDQIEGVGRQNWARGRVPNLRKIDLYAFERLMVLIGEVGKIDSQLQEKDWLQVLRMFRQLLVEENIQQ